MKKIPFCKDTCGREEIKAVKRVIKSHWLTTGKETEAFEKEFADYVGARYAVAVSSCTAALELCCRYLEVGRGDLVIVPSFTFCATAQAVENVGGNVLFGDIELVNLCLDPKSFIVKNYLKEAKAIIPVHLGGNRAFTNYKIPVIEDSAHRIEKDQCKNNRNLVCFSFYPTKNMTTGEGGMIATNDLRAYEWLRKARSHGRDKLVGSGYQVLFTGMKANLPDILSAVGRIQLKKLPAMTKRRNEIVALYNKYLGQEWFGNHLYPIFLKKRDNFIEYMKQIGVQCSAHFHPLHKQPGFSKYNKFKLPITEALGDTEVSLPLYPGLKDKQVKYIANLVNQWRRV